MNVSRRKSVQNAVRRDLFRKNAVRNAVRRDLIAKRKQLDRDNLLARDQEESQDFDYYLRNSIYREPYNYPPRTYLERVFPSFRYDQSRRKRQLRQSRRTSKKSRRSKKKRGKKISSRRR